MSKITIPLAVLFPGWDRATFRQKKRLLYIHYLYYRHNKRLRNVKTYPRGWRFTHYPWMQDLYGNQSGLSP